MMDEEFASTGALEMSVFQRLLPGNGRNPPRLALCPGTICWHEVDVVPVPPDPPEPPDPPDPPDPLFVLPPLPEDVEQPRPSKHRKKRPARNRRKDERVSF